MRVAQVNIVRPRDRIDPEDLLERWPTLRDIAGATQGAASAGARVSSRAVAPTPAPAAASPVAPVAAKAAVPPPAPQPVVAFNGGWEELIDRAQLRGPLGQLAQNATLIAVDGSVVRLAMNESYEHLAVGPMVAQLEQRLGVALGRDVKVRFERAGGGAQTPAEQRARADHERRSAAEESVQADPFVQSMIDTFGARVVPGSVRPLDG